MTGRKRNDYNNKDSEKRERKSERSELRPPDTSTLPSPLNSSQYSFYSNT